MMSYFSHLVQPRFGYMVLNSASLDEAAFCHYSCNVAAAAIAIRGAWVLKNIRASSLDFE